ncbi:MAG: hypothetical protein AAFO02_06875 [Bacteroidota bacterium]
MLLKHLLTLVWLAALPSMLLAQLSGQLVSYDYEQMDLGLALADLEDRFDLRFTYSPSRLPMDYPLSASVNHMEVKPAMDKLFADCPIKYAFIGDQIVLRSDPGRLTQIESRPTQPRQQTPLYQEPEREPRPRPTPPVTPNIPTREPRQISGGDQWQKDKLSDEELENLALSMERHERSLAMEEYEATHRLAQISILPYLGTNTHRSHEVTNNVSVNVFWGTSRAIDGFEVGGVGNTVVEDMHGFQLAGAVNHVGGSVIGTQMAGLVNFAGGKTEGAQLAGLVNIARDSMTGAQVAGLFNISGHDMDGAQVGGLFNWSEGDVGSQHSVFYNRARYVSRRQVGIINVCDTTAKAPYGLLNIVKYGYNRVEVGATEGLFVNLGAKLGTRKLYNIFHLGFRWDTFEQEVDGQVGSAAYTTWGLGYGLGIAPRLGKKTLLNVELVGMHINEMESWTNQLNLLGQFRSTFDFQLGERMSFYAGPSFNIMFSDLYDPVSDTYGSRVLPVDPLFNVQEGSTNIQGWVGFSAGLRM